MAASMAILGAVAPSQASYLLEFTESGADVVAFGSGSLDLDGFEFPGIPRNYLSDLNPLAGIAYIHMHFGAFEYSGISGPGSFGTGSLSYPSSGTGDAVGVGNGALVVPEDYVSGDSLSSSSTWTGASFASLGLTPGTYTWTWGEGANADSFTISIVPEPSSAGLLALGLVALASRRCRIPKE